MALLLIHKHNSASVSGAHFVFAVQKLPTAFDDFRVNARRGIETATGALLLAIIPAQRGL